MNWIKWLKQDYFHSRSWTLSNEFKWFQRAKAKELLEGNSNTKYFQLVANGKRRKTRIYRLEQDEGVIEGEERLKQYISK
jgi:hypothetical protein